MNFKVRKQNISPGKDCGNVLILIAVWVGEVAGPELGWLKGMNGLTRSISRSLPTGTCLAIVQHRGSISLCLHSPHSVAV